MTPSQAFLKSDKKPKLTPPTFVLDEAVEKRLHDIKRDTPKFFPLFHNVYARNKGLPAAVKAKCLDCSCWQMQEITNCTVKTCPLWYFRPYQTEESVKESDNEG